MGLVKIYSPDLGFHLRSAKWILDNRQFIYTDSFSYGSGGNPYYDLQWLFQLFVYGIYSAGGEMLLIIVNSLLITTSFVLNWRRFIKNAGIAGADIRQALFAFIGLLLILPLTFEIRPHVFSWLFLNLILFFLDSYKQGNKKAVIALPIIMIIWVNAHSLSILGLATIGIYNAGQYFEKKVLDKKLLLFSGLSFAAFLVNPYFLSGLAYPFTQFGIISGNSLLKSYIGEFQSPFSAAEMERLGGSYFVSALFFMHLAMVLAVLCIFRSVSRKQYTEFLLLTAFLILLFLAVKNYGYFLMASLPLLTKYTLAWLDERRKKRQKQKAPASPKKAKNKATQPASVPVAVAPKLYRRLSFIVIVAGLLIINTTITDGFSLYRGVPFRFGFTTDKDQLPVEAAAFLNKMQIRGKLMNHLDFGGYLMATYPEKVFIDGRLELLKPAFFANYHESLTKRFAVQKLLNEYNPDIVVFPYIKATYWWDYFVAKRKQSGYKPVYFDGLAVIYVKSSAYPQLPEMDEQRIMAMVDPNAINRMNEYVDESKPEGIMILFKSLWHKQAFSIADQNKASYCFANGFESAGLSYSVSGIENSTIHTPNIYKNLSVYYQDKKQYDLARAFQDKSE